MAELADAIGLGPIRFILWEFKSPPGHNSFNNTMNYLSKKNLLAVSLLITFLFLFPFLIKGSSDIPLEKPGQWSSLGEFIETIINFLFWLALISAPLMILVGAFYFMSSGGNPAKVETGKRVILYTVIGLFIILFARGIIAILRMILGS